MGSKGPRSGSWYVGGDDLDHVLYSCKLPHQSGLVDRNKRDVFIDDRNSTPGALSSVRGLRNRPGPTIRAPDMGGGVSELGVTPPKGGTRVYRRADLDRVLRLKYLLFVEGLTLAGARRKLSRVEAPAEGVETLGFEHLLTQDVRERLAELRGGLRAILEQLSHDARPDGEFSLIGPPHDGDAGTLRYRPTAGCGGKPCSTEDRENEEAQPLGPRLTCRSSGCSAAWLAHQTGGLGVAGSNPAIPTTFPP